MPDRITSADFQPEARVIQGDALAVLRTLEAESVHCVVCSPPYWSLRDYGVPGQLGLESTVQEYVANIVEVFREVRRVLRSDGTFWLNIGDSFNGSGGQGTQENVGARRVTLLHGGAGRKEWGGLKPKDKCMIPARVAIALQDDGWYLRQEIVWCKRAPMPESTRDRPTTAHEMVYLFAKSGDTTYYTHPNKPGVRGEVPPPDYRWHDNATGERTAIEPEGWRTELLEGGKTKRWRRINLWEGHDYFYDQEAERVESSPTSAGNRNAFRGGGSYTNGNSFDNGAVRPNAVPGNDGHPNGRNLWSYWLLSEDRWRLRSDLTPEQRAYVVQRLVFDGVHAPHDMAGLLEYFEPVEQGATPSTWLLSPDPYSEAHFATFPRELARRCISLGTSAYGCCGECQAPWARVVERENFPRGVPRTPTGRADKPYGKVPGSNTRGVPLRTVLSECWKPTCTHDAPVQPCTVLDPFSGAGTTGVVAVGLGRRYLGIELSAEYVRMSERRIAQTQPALPGMAV